MGSEASASNLLSRFILTPALIGADIFILILIGNILAQQEVFKTLKSKTLKNLKDMQSSYLFGIFPLHVIWTGLKHSMNYQYLKPIYYTKSYHRLPLFIPNLVGIAIRLTFLVMIGRKDFNAATVSDSMRDYQEKVSQAEEDGIKPGELGYPEPPSGNVVETKESAKLALLTLKNMSETFYTVLITSTILSGLTMFIDYRRTLLETNLPMVRLYY